MTDDERALVAHLRDIRIKTEAWVAEDPDNRWACCCVEDIEHWRSYGITSVAQFDEYQALCDAKEDRKNAYADYAEECERNMQAEELAHNEAIARYMQVGQPLTFTPFAFAL